MIIDVNGDGVSESYRSDDEGSQAQFPLARPVKETSGSGEDGSDSVSPAKHSQAVRNLPEEANKDSPAPSASQTVESKEDAPKSWDDIGRRLVEARKALDIASKADQIAGEELAAAQRKKNQTAEELKKRSASVTKLALEFTGATAVESQPQKLHMLAPRLQPAMTAGFRPRHPQAAPEFNPYGSQRFSRPEPSQSSFAANLLRITRAAPVEGAQSREPSNGADDQERKRIKITVKPADPEYAVGVTDEATRLTLAVKKKNSYGRSLFRGVRKVLSDGTFEARISVNGQDLLLGRFPVEEDAAKAYDTAVRKHRNPKDKAAVLNFPSEEDRTQGWRSTFEQAS